MDLEVLPGHWYLGGADVPALVSESDIRDGAKERNFADVQIWDDPARAPRPPGIPNDGSYDTVVLGRYIGPPGTLKRLPSEIKWVRDVTTQPTAPQPGEPTPIPTLPPALPPSSPPKPPAPTGWTPIFVLGAFAGGFIAVGAVGGYALSRVVWRR